MENVVFFVAILSKLLNKQSQCRRFATPRRSPNVIVMLWNTLQWRHNERDGVSNNCLLDYLLNRLFWCKYKKTSTLCVAGLCAGNSPVTGEFPAQKPSNAENVSIWCRHHDSDRRPQSSHHDDVIKWKHFPRNWPFVRGIHRSPVNSPHKGQWRGALVFSLIYVWINDWVNNREAGDLRRYRAHSDVIVMREECIVHGFLLSDGQTDHWIHVAPR